MRSALAGFSIAGAGALGAFAAGGGAGVSAVLAPDAAGAELAGAVAATGTGAGRRSRSHACHKVIISSASIKNNISL